MRRHYKRKKVGFKTIEVKHIVDDEIKSVKTINIDDIKTYNSLLSEILEKFPNLIIKQANFYFKDSEKERRLENDADYESLFNSKNSIETISIKEKRTKFIGVKHIKDEAIQSTKKINIYGIKTYHFLIEEILKHYQNLQRKSIVLKYKDELLGEIDMENDDDYRIFLEESKTKTVLLKEKKTTIEVKYANNEAVEITKTIDIANITTYYSLIKEILKQYDHLDINDIALTYKSSTCKNDDSEIDTDEGFEIFLKSSVDVISIKEKTPRKHYEINTIDLEEFNYKKIEKVEVDSLKEFHLEKNEDGKAKGLFLIIREDDDKTDISGEQDLQRYVEIANKLGFSKKNKNLKIMQRPDYSKEEFFKEIDEYNDKDHSDEDYFFLVLIGHGNNMETVNNIDNWLGEYFVMYSTEEKTQVAVTIEEIVRELSKCKLRVKGPIILFIEACRGGLLELSHVHKKVPWDAPNISDEETTTYNMKNLIVSFSTIPNTSSIAPKSGSIFTEELHKQMMHIDKKKEFHEVLTEVNNRVASRKLSGGVRQLSCFRSSFPKKLYFS